MLKKHCLFCDQIVPITAERDYDRYEDCSCSPGGFYKLLRDSYESILSLSHQQKRDMLHLVSAYIREMTDRGEKVSVNAGDLDSIVNSPAIPVTIEDKGNRLLQHLYRHSEGPLEPVVIQPLSSSYNLTYSPNLQELVYIIDKLGSDQLLIREGLTYKLTAQGWSEAAATSGGKKLKPCVVLLPEEEELRKEWQEKLLPKIEQYGYLPRLIAYSSETYSLESVADSKLIIADITGQSPEVYYTAGYALGRGIPVIWAVKSCDANNLRVHLQEIRPLVWDTAEDLVVLLQQKLSLD